MRTHLATAQPSFSPGPTPAPLPPETTGRRYAVVGFGNLFRGDHGVGLYALEALEQAGFGPEVRLDYIVGDYRNLMTCLYGTDVAVIVQADVVSGRPGDIHSLDLARFRTLAALDHHLPSRRVALAEMLGIIEAAYRLPRELRIVLVDPDPAFDDGGAGLSRAVRRGARRAVELTASVLERNGAVRQNGRMVNRVYRIPWLDMTL
ncbi:hydrogenase maturation protease [Desulfolutivibrio sp.]|uniref:hydrogenase maturation protease n=1 Tax=Desulfolutivibrio sp. TaxID=2773296 RepID=UPI002F966D14